MSAKVGGWTDGELNPRRLDPDATALSLHYQTPLIGVLVDCRCDASGT